MNNQRLTKNEIEQLQQLLNSLEALSEASTGNTADCRVYEINKHHMSWDKTTVNGVAKHVTVYLKDPIANLRTILNPPN